MKAPKCRLCGKEHYGKCDFGSTEIPAQVVVLEKALEAERAARLAAEDREKAAVARAEAAERKLAACQSKEAPTPKRDRTAYQREYMRKRRLKARGK